MHYGLTIIFNQLHDRLLPQFLRGKLGYFSRLQFSLLSRILKERLSSGVKMVNEVFLKQIRRLNYNLFYSKEELENRRITALIYELTQDEFQRSESDERSKNMKETEISILPNLVKRYSMRLKLPQTLVLHYGLMKKTES